MVFKKYEDIMVWQFGRELVRSVYALTSVGKFSKDWGLRDQVQRAAVSICSNIAEGYARRGNAEFIKFLWIAKGSAAEVQSQLYHAKDFGYMSVAQFDELYAATNRIQAGIFNLIQTLSSDVSRQKL